MQALRTRVGALEQLNVGRLDSQVAGLSDADLEAEIEAALAQLEADSNASPEIVEALESLFLAGGFPIGGFGAERAGRLVQRLQMQGGSK